jgi:hypothetical protein
VLTATIQLFFTFRRKIQFFVVGVNSTREKQSPPGASGLENRLTVEAC